MTISVLLFVGAYWFCPLDALAETDSLVEALRQRPPDRLIECTFDSGQFVRGYVVKTRADSLFLRTEKGNGPLTSHALADIARVREWRASTDRGARWGAVTGAVAVGTFGTLVGLIASSMGSSTDSDIAPVFGGALFGAGFGYLAGGILGSGVGALINGWYQAWPVDPTLNHLVPPAVPRSQHTRVGLFAGTAHSLLDGYAVNRFAGRVGVHKILNDNVSLGPDFGYFGFDDPIVIHSPQFTEVKTREHMLMFALTTTLQPHIPVMAPYATLGVGWFLSNDNFAGAQVGGGLRFHVTRSAELDLDLRYHFSFAEVNASQVDRFWTLGLGLGFDN